MRGSPSHPRPSRRDRLAQVWQCESSLDCMDTKLTGKRPEFFDLFSEQSSLSLCCCNFFPAVTLRRARLDAKMPAIHTLVTVPQRGQ